MFWPYLHNPNDFDRTLYETVADKIRSYRAIWCSQNPHLNWYQDPRIPTGLHVYSTYSCAANSLQIHYPLNVKSGTKFSTSAIRNRSDWSGNFPTNTLTSGWVSKNRWTSVVIMCHRNIRNHGTRRKYDDVIQNFHGSWAKCLRVLFLTPVEGRRDRWSGYPPDWDQWSDNPDPLCGNTTGLPLVGECLLFLVLLDLVLGVEIKILWWRRSHSGLGHVTDVVPVRWLSMGSISGSTH